MVILAAYFNCGIIERNKNMVYLKVTNFSDNFEKIRPFFKVLKKNLDLGFYWKRAKLENGLVGIKQKDKNILYKIQSFFGVGAVFDVATNFACRFVSVLRHWPTSMLNCVSEGEISRFEPLNRLGWHPTAEVSSDNILVRLVGWSPLDAESER